MITTPALLELRAAKNGCAITEFNLKSHEEIL